MASHFFNETPAFRVQPTSDLVSAPWLFFPKVLLRKLPPAAYRIRLGCVARVVLHGLGYVALGWAVLEQVTRSVSKGQTHNKDMIMTRYMRNHHEGPDVEESLLGNQKPGPGFITIIRKPKRLPVHLGASVLQGSETSR